MQGTPNEIKNVIKCIKINDETEARIGEFKDISLKIYSEKVKKNAK